MEYCDENIPPITQDLNKEQLQVFYENLKILVVAKLSKLEDQNRNLQNANLKLEASETLLEELQHEKEGLELTLSKRKLELDKAREENLQKLRLKLQDQCKDSNAEIETKDAEIASLKIEIVAENEKKHAPVDLDQYEANNQKLKAEIITLKESLLKLQTDYKLAKEMKLKEEQELVTYITNLKENLTMKEEECSDIFAQIKAVQDELVLLRSELAVFKEQPQQSSRDKGNSMFAEVHDRSVALNEQIKMRRNECQQLHSKYASELSKIKTHTKAIDILCGNWIRDLQLYYVHNDRAAEQIKTLIMQKLEEVNLTSISCDGINSTAQNPHVEVLVKMIEAKHMEIRIVKKHIKTTILKECVLHHDMYKLNQKLRRLQFSYTQSNINKYVLDNNLN